MEELTGLFDLPQRSAKMVEGRGRSREGIGRRREAPLASVRLEGRRKNGLVGGVGPARSHQAQKAPTAPSLAVGCLTLPPRSGPVATYPRQQADGTVDVDPVPTAITCGGRTF